MSALLAFTWAPLPARRRTGAARSAVVCAARGFGKRKGGKDSSKPEDWTTGPPLSARIAERRASKDPEDYTAVAPPPATDAPVPVAPPADPRAAADALQQYFPPAGRNLAPHIVFVSRSAIVLDNTEVRTTIKPEDPLPENSAYAWHYPKHGDTLNWAPHIDIETPKSSVSVAMTRVSPGLVSREDAPDRELYAKYYPDDVRDLAPEISMTSSPGMVGVQMKAVDPVPPVVRTSAQIDPAKYSAAYRDDETLHMAPHISMSDGVIKLEMRPVFVDPAEIDRPPFDGYPQHGSNLNRAPLLQVHGKNVGDFALSLKMEEMPSFVSLNAAPVIEFHGKDGREKVSLQMRMISGDPSTVDVAALTEEDKAPEVTYNKSWKPSSTIFKSYV